MISRKKESRKKVGIITRMDSNGHISSAKTLDTLYSDVAIDSKGNLVQEAIVTEVVEEDGEFKFFRISLTNLKKKEDANKKNRQHLPFCSYCGNKYLFDMINMKCNTCGRNVRKPKNITQDIRCPNQKYFNFFDDKKKTEERTPIDIFRPSMDNKINEFNNRDNCLCNCLIM